MKNILLLIVLSLFTTGSFAQKKKAAKPTSKSNKETLAKADNVSAELFRGKDQYRLYLLAGKTATKDTLKLKTVDVTENFKSPAAKNNNIPVECAIKSFLAKGVTLYSIVWKEYATTEITDRKDEITRTVTEIWDIDNKLQLQSNTQTTTKITEKLYLDAGHNASQTSEKLRREGFELTITPDGDLILKNKTQENRMTYDPAQKKYVALKSSAQPAPAAAKKKR